MSVKLSVSTAELVTLYQEIQTEYQKIHSPCTDEDFWRQQQLFGAQYVLARVLGAIQDEQWHEFLAGKSNKLQYDEWLKQKLNEGSRKAVKQ